MTQEQKSDKESSHYDYIYEVSGCEIDDVNGYYYYFRHPKYANMKDKRYFQQKSTTDLGFYVYDPNKGVISLETPLETFATLISQYDHDTLYCYSRPGGWIYEPDDNQEIPRDQVSDEVYQVIRDAYNHMSDSYITHARVRTAQKFLQNKSMAQKILFTFDTQPKKWVKCDNSDNKRDKKHSNSNKMTNNSSLKIKRYDLTKIGILPKDDLKRIEHKINENSTRYHEQKMHTGINKYETVYNDFFDKLIKFLNDIVCDLYQFDINFMNGFPYSVLKEYLFCHHCSISIMNIQSIQHQHSSMKVDWILFFCNICGKSWKSCDFGSCMGNWLYDNFNHSSHDSTKSDQRNRFNQQLCLCAFFKFSICFMLHYILNYTCICIYIGFGGINEICTKRVDSMMLNYFHLVYCFQMLILDLIVNLLVIEVGTNIHQVVFKMVID